jgi:hypothetical protein
LIKSNIAYSITELIEKINFFLKNSYIDRRVSEELALSLRGDSGEKIASVLNSYTK